MDSEVVFSLHLYHDSVRNKGSLITSPFFFYINRYDHSFHVLKSNGVINDTRDSVYCNVSVLARFTPMWVFVKHVWCCRWHAWDANSCFFNGSNTAVASHFLLLSASLFFTAWQNSSLKAPYPLFLVSSAADGCYSAKLACYTGLYNKSAFFLWAMSQTKEV